MSRARLLFLALTAAVALLVGASTASADTTPQTLPFGPQGWTTTTQITTDDNWNGVPGIIGYRGDGLSASTSTDPQTVVADGSATPIDVNANRADPNTFATGGVTEFDGIGNPVVALQGSGTADAPHLVISLNTTGAASVGVTYNVRDIDGSADNAIQQVALQYRVGASGNYTNIPAGYVADATTGGTATQSTAVSVTLPAAAANQPVVQLRVITNDAVGSDEWVGIDDITVTAGPATDTAPTVSSTTPTNGATNVATNANISITFSEAVNVIGTWFTISCGTSGSHTATVTGGPTTFMLDPSPDFANSETCTVTVVAAQVTDQDSDDPPDNMAADYVFMFSTAAPPPPLTLIHTVQGASHISPMNTQSVSVRGIVTGRRSNGFYMQEENADADSDDATSEGIFVFTSSTPTSVVGDDVTVSGTVTEFRPGGSSSTNLTTTELTSPVIVTNSSGNPMPTSVVIGSGGRVPPNMVIEDDSSPDIETGNTFDPASDGIDFYESLEGMLAQVNNPVAVGPTNFGEIPVLADDGAGASVRTARLGIVVRSNDFNPERIFLDDEILLVSAGSMPLANVSDHLAGSVTGVFDYSFGNYKLELTSTPTLVSAGLTQETTATPAANEIAIATFNVENLDPGDGGTKFATLAGLIVNNLKSPDIIALEEIQDNNGATNDSTTDASTTFNTLIGAIVSAGGPTYAYTQIDPVDDQDGGEPGGNIRVGFIYRTDRGVSFVSKPGATPTTANSVNAGGLVFSPGRIDPTNPAFNNSRKPLAAEFMWNTQKLYLIANHWNSKGGDDPLFGRFQPPVQSSQTQRNAQAAVVNQFVDDILANDSLAQIVVLGDFNDFEFSGPLNTLTANGTVLHDLYYWIPQAERYSYVFDGNSQALDHILVSTQTASRGPLYDVVHVNSEFANQVSDHEPQVLRYDPLNQPTTAVEVAGLSAKRTKAGVVVRWRTGNESRIAGFNVYRQRAGKLLRVNAKLIRAKAAGKAVGRAYSWRDALARPGSRYRLQVVRLDGTRAWVASARS